MPKKKYPKKTKKDSLAPPNMQECSLYDFGGDEARHDDIQHDNEKASLKDRLRAAVKQSLMDGLRSKVIEELRSKYRHRFTEEVQVMLAIDEVEWSHRDEIKKRVQMYMEIEQDNALARLAGEKLSKNLVRLVKESLNNLIEEEVPKQFAGPSAEQVREDLREKLEEQFTSEVPAYIEKVVAECKLRYL